MLTRETLTTDQKLTLALARESMSRAMRKVARKETSEAQPVGKKMGVWVDGVLKLQTRNRDAIDDYYNRVVNEKLFVNGHHVPRYSQVWVAPIGSFVTV